MAAPQFKNLPDLLGKSVARFAGNPLFGTRTSDGRWEFMTYREFGEQVDAFRAALAGLGVGDSDSVAVIANNRVEWAVAAYAIYGRSAFIVPMYEKQTDEDRAFILRDSDASVVIVANSKIAASVAANKKNLPKLRHVIDLAASEQDPMSFSALLKKGRENPVAATDPDESHLCGFIYTSGTTGNPKGVRLSHGNIASNVNAVQQLFPMVESDRSLSFLPWAHSFGQTVELHTGISFGISMAICDNVEKLIPYLGEVQPSLLFSVPRIFNRIYDGLNKKMAAAPPLRRKLFEMAMSNATARRKLEEAGGKSAWVEMKHALFDKLVFSKIRALIGGKLRYAVSGGAAISTVVAEFIDNCGISVFEGYGLSETSPIATANYPGNRRIGSVGKAIPGVEIIVDTAAVGGAMGDQGEILVKGPNVMQGYHNLAEETAKVMRDDGAFRTGDLGRKDKDGYVYITGRIKEQYKLENGKYVVPAPLEEQLKLSGFIANVMVFGANKPFNVGIVVPDWAALEAWAKEQGLSAERGDLVRDARVNELLNGEIERFSSGVFKGFEKLRAFRPIVEDFTVDNDMLTPSMKVKRRNVIAAYQVLIDEMYASTPDKGE